MNKYWKILIFLLLLIVILYMYYRKYPLQPSIIINNRKIVLELAVTDTEKEKGLGYRKILPDDHGMLFLYDHKEYFPFWMKGMNFPLDFVWISGNTVADVTAEVPILTNNQVTVVKPNVQVDKILELNSGSILKYNIKIGDRVIFKN
jgi:uncharacterized protein